MFCEKCGTQNKDDAKFCGKCGAELRPIESIVESSAVETARKNRRIGMAAVGLIAFLLLIGVSVFFRWIHGNDKSRLIGTWRVIEGDKMQGEKLVLSENGAVKEELGIFEDSYGISWQISDGKIQFIYYGNMEAQAEYELDGDELTLRFEEDSDVEDDDIVLEKQ